jgi:3-oxoacyl-[acyl-carrier protein] reductase
VNLGLEGRVALVTGAAGGLGSVIARHLVEEGAQVVLSDVDVERLEAVGAEIGAARVVVADITDASGAAQLVDETLALGAGLDVLVPAAGAYDASPLEAIVGHDWDRIQAVNVKGTFLTAQAALRAMMPARSGSIVTLGSIAGQVGGVQSGAGYATSKAAVLGMTKALARAAGPYGIRVNCVSPGFIEAGMSLGITPEDRERTIGMTPLARPGTADEVASAVLWLASDAASFVTGAHLDVNGGLFMA